jgi:hypothetical protein
MACSVYRQSKPTPTVMLKERNQYSDPSQFELLREVMALVLHHSKFDGCYGHGVQSGQPIYMEDDQHAHEKISRDTQGR